MKILIATTNPAKFAEITKFLSDLQVDFVSLKDVGITEEVVEDGKTYEENSQKKALFYSKLSGLPAISDDGGLEIESLGGEPGVKSSCKIYYCNNLSFTRWKILEPKIRAGFGNCQNPKGETCKRLSF